MEYPTIRMLPGYEASRFTISPLIAFFPYSTAVVPIKAESARTRDQRSSTEARHSTNIEFSHDRVSITANFSGYWTHSMIHRTLITGLLLVLLAFVNSAAADEKDAKAKGGGKSAKQAKALFEKIKSLSGEWEHQGSVALSVRVIAGGSAVVQREFPGSPMEMITVYHLDGDKVMLNHYCMLGNQPRLRATMGDQKNTILFNFVGATNLASINDPHMHEGKLTILGKDSIKSTWTKFVDGKAAEKHTFEMTRKKKSKPNKAQ